MMSGVRIPAKLCNAKRIEIETREKRKNKIEEKK